jgi:hypothetical protein
MGRKNVILALAAAIALSACNTVETTRNAPIEAMPSNIGLQSTRSATWRISDVKVVVPGSLSVSEANLYIPKSDIVWREDPFGDRRAQVQGIVEMGVKQALLNMDGVQPVVVYVEVTRFHALSQKARATVGGVHNMSMNVTIMDAETGLQLIDTFPIEMKLKAFGGQKAIDAEMRGETQKVRIIRHISSVFRTYFSA